MLETAAAEEGEEESDADEIAADARSRWGLHQDLWPVLVHVHAGESIAHAIEAADPGTVLLLRGLHYRQRVIMKSGVALVATERGATTIEPWGDQCALQCWGVTEALVAGIIFQGGREDGSCVAIRGGSVRMVECDVLHARGTGIRISGENDGESSCNPEFVRCTACHSADKGVYIHSGAAAPRLVECEVGFNEYGVVISSSVLVENECGAIRLASPTAAVLERCRVHHSTEEGVLVRKGATPTLLDCVVEHNQDGLIVKDAYPVVSNMLVQHNQSGHSARGRGVYFYGGARGTLADSHIHANSRDLVISNIGTAPVIRGCTIGTVQATGGAGGLVEACDVLNRTEIDDQSSTIVSDLKPIACDLAESSAIENQLQPSSALLCDCSWWQYGVICVLIAAVVNLVLLLNRVS